jgi:hypothetical protein
MRYNCSYHAFEETYQKNTHNGCTKFLLAVLDNLEHYELLLEGNNITSQLSLQ